MLEAGLSYPVIRTREANLTLTALGFLTNDYAFAFGAPFTRDRIRGVPPQGRCRLGRPLPRHQSGQRHVQPGHQRASARPTTPIPNAPLPPLPPPSTNAGRVDFSKVEGTFSRAQPLWAKFSLFVAAYGQYAFTPLLVSEQCSYGGRFFGRAFDPSQMLGDHCWAVLGELRYDIPTSWKQLTRLQLYAYADHGEVYIMEPALGTPASQHGTSVGGGVRVAWEDIYSADLSVAKAVEGPRDDWRAFLILGAKY